MVMVTVMVTVAALIHGSNSDGNGDGKGDGKGDGNGDGGSVNPRRFLASRIPGGGCELGVEWSLSRQAAAQPSMVTWQSLGSDDP